MTISGEGSVLTLDYQVKILSIKLKTICHFCAFLLKFVDISINDVLS